MTSYIVISCMASVAVPKQANDRSRPRPSLVLSVMHFFDDEEAHVLAFLTLCYFSRDYFGFLLQRRQMQWSEGNFFTAAQTNEIGQLADAHTVAAVVVIVAVIGSGGVIVTCVSVIRSCEVVFFVFLVLKNGEYTLRADRPFQFRFSTE